MGFILLCLFNMHNVLGSSSCARLRCIHKKTAWKILNAYVREKIEDSLK